MAAGVDFPKSLKSKGWIPDRVDFERAIRNIKGAPGFDGWGRRGSDRCCAAAPTKQLLPTLFSWRVVGISKKTPMQSRPIGVASVLVRDWISANAAMLPTNALQRTVGQQS